MAGACKHCHLLQRGPWELDSFPCSPPQYQFDDFELPRIKYLVVPSVVNACNIIVHKVLMTKYNTHLCVSILVKGYGAAT